MRRVAAGSPCVAWPFWDRQVGRVPLVRFVVTREKALSEFRQPLPEQAELIAFWVGKDMP